MLRRLKQLAAEAHENLYERLQLASQLLATHTWLSAKFSGSATLATEHLQTAYFNDLGGYITLHKMLEIFRTFSREQWEYYRFDLRAMEVIFDQPKLLTSPATPQDADAAKRRVAEMSYYVRYESDNLSPIEERTRLQRRLEELKAECDRIKLRLRELRRVAA